MVLLAVLLIPLFLGEPKQSVEKDEVPKSTAFRSKIQPLPQSQDPNQFEKGDHDRAVEQQGGLVLKKIDTLQLKPAQTMRSLPQSQSVRTATPAPTETAKKHVIAPKKPAPVKIIAKAKAPKDPVISTAWAVQAGIFSKRENAQSIARVLKSNGHQPKLNNTSTSFGQATRVWVGPFASKAEAQALSNIIEQQTGNGGYVAEYPFKS